ncbi:MAG: radical SAM protein [Candidatus Ratteibacteria bacterium]|jgi:radical SAM protein with 4Fe4S-binding SPASM domain
MSQCYAALTSDFEFKREEIDDVLKNGRILSLEIEFSRRCNFRCPYCYVADKAAFDYELSREEIRDTILQAKELGARKIIILGGEPMVYDYTMEMIDFIHSYGLNIQLFTNGTNITSGVAKQLLEKEVDVVLKINSLKEKVQDELAGKKGAFKSIRRAFENLKHAGYPTKRKKLAVSTPICRQNFDELTGIWKWLREQNVVPYFEIITPQGRAKENSGLDVSLSQLKKLFFDISEIDRTCYGHVWEPQPPLVGIRCLRHQFSCLVNSNGYVLPCIGIDIPVGNIRERKLKDIINDSKLINDLRNYRRTIKGPCRNCDKIEHCYGCRGKAYQLTGDPLASDPLCWRNTEHQEKIVSLSVPVDDIIPQRFPMRVVDKLIRIAERKADVTAIITRENLFARQDGTLDEAVYLELIAQSIAALDGFKHTGVPDVKTNGFLLGAKNIEILDQARVGDNLKISVFEYARYGNFSVIEGTIYRKNKVLARGEIKVWHAASKRNREKK